MSAIGNTVILEFEHVLSRIIYFIDGVDVDFVTICYVTRGSACMFTAHVTYIVAYNTVPRGMVWF